MGERPCGSERRGNVDDPLAAAWLPDGVASTGSTTLTTTGCVATDGRAAGSRACCLRRLLCLSSRRPSPPDPPLPDLQPPGLPQPPAPPLPRWLVRGALVRIWSTSQNRWFDDGTVEEVVHERQEFRVRFKDGNLLKWVKADAVASDIERMAYRWTAVSMGDTLPDRSVLVVGGSSEAYVGWANNELGQLALADCPGPKSVDKIREHEKGEALVRGAGFAAKWVPVRRGDPLPEGVVCIARHKGVVCIARHKNEFCTLTSSSAADISKVEEILLPGAERIEECDVLSVVEVPGELEVEFVRFEGLRDPEYRAGDLVAGVIHRHMKPYVEMEFQGLTWRSGWTKASDSGDAALGDRVHVPLPEGNPLGDDLVLSLRVLDNVGIRSMVRGDPLFGSGSLYLGEALRCSNDLQTLELLRNSCHGRLVWRVHKLILMD